MTQTIFDVVAKDPKEEHVAEDVGNAAVHEHRSDQRQIDGNRRRLESRHFDAPAGKRVHDDAIASDYVPAGNDLRWNGGVGVSELIVCSQVLKKHKDQNICQDQQIVNYRCRPDVGIVVGNWE